MSCIMIRTLPVKLRRVLLSSLLVLFFQVSVEQQCPAQQAEIDSLQKQLERAERDTARVNLLNTLSEMLVRRSLKQSMSCGKEALELAVELDYPEGERAALTCIGIVHAERWELGKAMEYLEKSMDVARKIGSKRGIGKALYNIGQTRILQGYFDRGLKDMLRSVEMTRKANDRNDLAVSLHGIGTAYIAMAEYEKAIDYLEQSLEISEDLGDRREEGLACNNLGIVHSELGNLKLALEYFQRTLESSREFGDTYATMGALNNIGSIHATLGNPQQALKHFSWCLEIVERTGDLEKKAMILNNMAEIYGILGEDQKSLEYLLPGLELSKEPEQRLLRATILHNLGNVYAGMERDTLALDYFFKGLKIEEALRHKSGMLKTLSSIGLMYGNWGDLSQGIEYLQRSLEIAKEINERSSLQMLHENLSLAFRESGEYEKAIEHHRLSSDLKDSIQSEQSRIHINELTAKYKADEQEKQILLLEKDNLLQSLELRQRQDVLKRQQLESDRRAQEIVLLNREKEIRQLEVNKTSAELRRREKEAELLNNDHMLRSNIVERQTLARNGAIAGSLLLLISAVLVIRRFRDRRETSELRAEAAEYQAQAAEADSLALRAENERIAKEAQKAFSRQLMESQEQERKRIAAELHDGLGQDLLVIKNRLELSAAEESTDATAIHDIEEIGTVVASTLQEVRQISRNLRPPQLDRLGLTRAIISMVRNVDRTTPIRFSDDIDSLDNVFRKQDEINVYRIVQEGINNILKHSSARCATIRVDHVEDYILVSIEDDGSGFTEYPRDHSQGFGLLNMKERADMLGGNMEIESSPGEGTRIVFRFPIAERTAVHETEN